MSVRTFRKNLQLPRVPGKSWEAIDPPAPQPIGQPGHLTPIAPTAPVARVAPSVAPTAATTAPTQLSAKAARPRNEAIDVVRFFAAAGIVFVHSAYSETFHNGWDNLFRFAVPFYLFASLYFQAISLRRNPDRSLGELAIVRFKRLYLPFLVWSVIYILARDLKRVVLLGMPAVELHPSMLWKGTEYHLWFLPFLLGVSIVQAILHRATVRRDARWRWALAGALLASGVVIAVTPPPANWSEIYDNPTYTYVQWWRAGPTTCWAMAFAWLMTAGPTVLSVSSALGLFGVALTLVCLVKQALHGLQLIPRSLSGLGCMLASLAPWSTSCVSTFARLGRSGYGIYLSHVLIVEVIREMSFRLHLATSAWLDVFNFSLSFACALIFVRVVSRFSWTSWLNG